MHIYVRLKHIKLCSLGQKNQLNINKFILFKLNTKIFKKEP